MKSRKIDLILDGSKEENILLLSFQNTLIDQITLNTKKPGSSLVAEISKLLEKNQFGVENIENLFIGIGPGSYTGVRVAVSVAEGLSLALNIPLYPFYSNLAYLPADMEEGPFTLIVKGKHTHFLLQGSLSNESISPQITHLILEEDKLSSYIEKEPKALFLDLEAKLNSSLLLPYLAKIKKQAPNPCKIIYLHDF